MSYTVEQHHLPARCYGQYIDGPKKGAVPHHAVALSLQGCYNTLLAAGLSTYATIHHKTVWVLMPDWHNREFSCGDTRGNSEYISVELINESLDPATGYRVADDTIETFCEFIADLTRQGAIAPVGGRYTASSGKGDYTSLLLHRYVSATACPGDHTAALKGQMAERINALLAPAAPAAWPVQLYRANLTAAQEWRPVHNEDGTVTLIEQATGRALDVTGASAAKGAVVQAYRPNGTAAQRWGIIGATGAYAPEQARPVELVPAVNADMRLDAVGGGTANGTELQLYPANNTDAQRWVLLDKGKGTWVIANVGSGLVLDIVNGGR